jgi:urea transporter
MLSQAYNYVRDSQFLGILLFTADPRWNFEASRIALTKIGTKRRFLVMILEIAIGSLRGVGQVAFVNSAVTGTLIFIGCALDRPLAALMGLSACTIGTVLGIVTQTERESAKNGLCGYNGYLFGMGLGYFSASLTLNPYDWLALARLLPALMIGSVICYQIHVALAHSMSVPPFTFAYNITLSCWLAYTTSLSRDSVFIPSFFLPPPQEKWITYSDIDFPWLFTTSLAGVGQVFFSPELRSSIIILCGLAVGSPIAALMGFFGSVIGSGVAILTHGSMSQAEAGIYGLSAVLASIGLGSFYFSLSWRSLFLATIGSILSIMMTPLMAGLLVRPGGPCMTFPFCLAASLLYLSAKHLGHPVLVPKTSLESPEIHCIKRKDFQSFLRISLESPTMDSSTNKADMTA